MAPFTKIFLSILIAGSAWIAKGQETVKDYDGNVYKTIKVGKQVWMAENLRVTHYRNGDAIPGVKDQKQWEALTSGAYSTVGGDPVKEIDPVTLKALGQIYNWYVVADQRKVCPAGWHVPTESEWLELVTFLAGEKLTPTITSAKIPAKNRILNENLFKDLPVDYFRGYDLDCSHVGYGGGGWWTSTTASPETAFYHSINYNTASRNRMEARKKFGYSIRCIKD